ncbi:MAG: L-threonylcarbamoyladenylate synthase [Thermoplasmata archaeon]
MQILKINENDIHILGEFIKNDFAVVPTDTLYALSISIYSANAAKIYNLKNRTDNVPVPVAVNSIEMMYDLAEVPDLAIKILDNTPKGAITLVLKNKKVPKCLVSDTVGIRIPNSEVISKLVEIAGPITITSANLHGGKAPNTLSTAIEELKGRVQMFLDGGTLSGIPSTVIKVNENSIELVREGVFKWKKIINIVNEYKSL